MTLMGNHDHETLKQPRSKSTASKTDAAFRAYDRNAPEKEELRTACCCTLHLKQPSHHSYTSEVAVSTKLPR